MANLKSTRVRGYLLASTALLALPGVAQADTGRPTDAISEAHSNRPDVSLTEAHSNVPTGSIFEAHSTVPTVSIHEPQAPLGGASIDTPQIIINNNFTPTDIRDPQNINGVSQMIINNGDGSIGLCTATLINPRVVLFAAHCVNSRAATAYGANSGGTPIGFGFETNTRANAAGQPDELLQWFTGPRANQTNQAQAFYNASQVFYNIASTEAAARGFLYADVATAVLDTPTRNIPTWALMFSPLPTPGSINPATGTGYHVNIMGYGQNGLGSTGGTGSDYRRRAAENMLGALTSLDRVDAFLFGSSTRQLPQVLYMTDFDDPRRGTSAANPYDFNLFRDNALTREGVTAPGDSGGPLVLDRTFSKQVVIGVLSGGTRYFNAQPGSSYGTSSFYQPLFLYWDYIVANNPYRYVTAIAGNRNWEDAAGWVTELDPAYNILVNGQLVNGIPTNLGGGKTGSAPNFGEICFQSPLNSPTPPASNECQNLATGADRNNVPNTPNGQADGAPLTMQVTDRVADNNADTVQVAQTGAKTVSGTGTGLSSGLHDAIAGSANVDGAIHEAQADPGYSDTVRPAATLANGLPGATNFVPNNVDGTRTTGVAGKYYDVTLRNTGAVTLNSAVTIDRFSISGATSQLNVSAGASLTSLIEVMQNTGTVVNNGTITTGGDYLLTSGLLTGTGRVNTPFLTNILGSIAPGTIGTVGTFTLGGNRVLSSGSTLLVDLGSTGSANIGGRVLLTPVSGSTVRANDLFTILTAAGGVTGTFNPSSALSAILTPQFVYNANSVQVRLVAGLFANVVGNTPVQQAYAGLLDRNRAGNRAGLGAVYDFLDLQSAATIQSTLEGLAPRTETLVRSLATAGVDNMNRFYRGRLEALDLGDGYDGQLAIVGSPLQVLASGAGAGTMTAGAAAAITTLQPDAQVQPGRLPQGVRGYVAGGYLDGKSRSMPTAIPFGGKDKFDGWYVATGVEAMAGDNAAIGVGFSYSDLDGDTRGVTQRVGGRLYQGTVYGKTLSGSGLALDGRLSAGLFELRTRRAAVLGPTTYDLRSRDNALAISGEAGAGYLFGEAIQFGPRVAFRTNYIDFSRTVETGGPLGLRIARNNANNAQGLAGLTLGSSGLSFRPHASAYYVHEFLDNPAAFGANFANGVGGNSLFALSGQDRNWGEVAVGVTFGSDRFSVSLGADTTVFRKDVENQAYRGSVSIKF